MNNIQNILHYFCIDFNNYLINDYNFEEFESIIHKEFIKKFNGLNNLNIYYSEDIITKQIKIIFDNEIDKLQNEISKYD